MSDAFTKANPDEFDVDGWISNARLPERSQTVYGRADLVAEYEALDQELTAARQADTADERMGDRTTSTARRMAELRSEMMASAKTFRFRALSREEQRSIRAAAPKEPNGDPDADFISEHTVAAAAFDPKLTPAQATALRGKIGEGQWVLLWEAAAGASVARVSVPFSLAASVALSSQDS